MSEPIVTVLVCCYSGERFFEETVASVISQNFEGVKICFHDNGSSASYSEMISSTARKLGAQLIRTEVNRYGEGVRFDVLSHITTKYVATIHDDDLFLPGKLAAGIEVLELNDLDFVFGDRVYIDEKGQRFVPATEEVNVKEFEKGDYPFVFIAELFFRGLRFHYSTLIMKTDLAQRVVYGDPYLPRIADCLFVTRLLLDRRLRGAATPSKLSAIRVHGSNDMLYSKFDLERRAREVALLSNAELFIFQEMLSIADDQQLAFVFSVFPGVPIVPGESRAALLLRAALQLRLWSRSKKMMAASCVHAAFKADPLLTMGMLRELTGSDGNTLMTTLYSEYIEGEFQAVLSLGPPVRPLTELSFGAPMKFSERAADEWLVSGFSDVEPWGRWTDGVTARMQFAVHKAKGDFEIEIVPDQIFVAPGGESSFTISVNGAPARPAQFVSGKPFKVPVSAADVRNNGELIIEIQVLAPKRPCDQPLGDDRLLGVGFATLTAKWADTRKPTTSIMSKASVEGREHAKRSAVDAQSTNTRLKRHVISAGNPDRQAVSTLYRLGDWVHLDLSGSSDTDLHGFSAPEEWGRWTEGTLARLIFNLPASTAACAVELDVASVFPTMAGRSLGVRLGQGVWREHKVEAGELIKHALDEVGPMMLSGEHVVELRIPCPKTPDDPPSDDRRALGVGLRRVRLVERNLRED